MGPVDLAKNFRICLSQLLMNIPPGSSSKPVGAHYFIQAGGVSIIALIHNITLIMESCIVLTDREYVQVDNCEVCGNFHKALS